MAKKTTNESSAFTGMLASKSAGVRLADLDEALAELVRHVTTQGGKGSLVYKLTVSPNSHRGVKLSDSVETKLPKEKTGDSFFFAKENGELSVNDPAQMDIPFHDPAAAARPEPRQVQ